MGFIAKITRNQPGILYVLAVEMEGKTLVKIGVTHRKIEDRVCEILTGIFKCYREFPYCRPKRYKVVSNVYQKEKTLHKQFKKFKYIPKNKFTGCNEFFDIDLDTVVEAYEKLLEDDKVKRPYKKRKKVKITEDCSDHF